MACDFCNLKDLKPRIFYNKDNWIAFLAAPYHITGHTILIRFNEEVEKCPQGLNEEVLRGLGCAIADVSKALMSCKYPHTTIKPKNILFASLRGDLKHFHVHLIPLWEDKEKEWRREKIENNHLCYEKGHLMEYLGNLEREGDKKASIKRNENGWTSKEQLNEIIKKVCFQNVLQNLRKITVYKQAK